MYLRITAVANWLYMRITASTLFNIVACAWDHPSKKAMIQINLISHHRGDGTVLNAFAPTKWMGSENKKAHIYYVTDL